MITPDARTLASELQGLLGTRLPPIAIAYLDAAPAGIPLFPGTAPASCSYWRLAAEGLTFATEASHHQGCPIGAHTHGVALTAETSAELQGLVGTMVQLGYLRADEVPQIPHRAPGSFKSAVYGPLGSLPVAPELVLVRGTARQLMLLAEAAQMAGIAGSLSTMGRPTCAALPLAEQGRQPAISLGCIGNRVYTGLADEEAYAAIPAALLATLLRQLATVVRANLELEKFHRARA